MDNNFLTKILETKHQEVASQKLVRSHADLLREAEARQDVRGFANALHDKITHKQNGVIAEIKKASPSKGLIAKNFQPAEIAAGYAAAGATCLSVLTDQTYFQGSHDYLRQARAACSLPVLYKNFIIDPYQITHARSVGADCILLIVASLSPKELVDFEAHAIGLGMDVLVEVHDQKELETALTLKTPLLGINNRDLRSFKTDLQNTVNLLKYVPNDRLVITESGIHQPQDIQWMNDQGVYGFLIGEAFMREEHPGQALARFLSVQHV